MKNLIFPLLFFVVFPYCLFSQNLDSISTNLSSEKVITLFYKRKIDLKVSNGKLNINESFDQKKFFIDPENKYDQIENIYFDNFKSITKIDAYTDNKLIDRKSRIKRVANIATENLVSRGIFYSDQMKRIFIYPELSKKSIGYLSYDVKLKDAHFIEPFSPTSEYPIQQAEFVVDATKNITLGFKCFNIDSTKVSYEKFEKIDKIIHTWKFKNVEKYKSDYDFSPSYYIPQIMVYVKNYTSRGKKINVSENMDDLYKWYHSLYSKTNKLDQSPIKKLSFELTDGLQSDEEKIKKLFYFVQNKINYIAIEDGLNGFIPRDAVDIYRNKYGDCKDMANLLNELLNYAGIKSYMTWIGTRRKPYKYSELPTTYADNHMIVSIEHKGRFYFLDPTAKYLQFGYPSPFIQGKDALIGISKNTYKIIPVSIVPATKNMQLHHNEMQLNQNFELVGKHHVSITGYEKLEANHFYNNVDQNKQDFTRLLLNLGNKKSVISDANYTGLELEKDSLQLSFTSNFDGYAKKSNSKIYVKLNVDNSLKFAGVKGTLLELDKKIDYKYSYIFETKFKIPQGYTVSSLPKKINLNHKLYDLQIDYKQEANYIYLHKKIQIKDIKVAQKELKTWNDFVKKVSRENKKSITLIKL